MIEQLIAEATECDFKVALEIKKPKNLLVYWLSKSHLFYKKIFESTTGKWPA